jgi:hypothetical protein
MSIIRDNIEDIRKIDSIEATANQATVIDDDAVSLTDTWSSSKISGELDDKLEATDIAGKLDLSGGTMTGAITSMRETRVSMGANDIDLASGNYFTKTISAATTLTVSNVPTTGQSIGFILELTNGGSSAVTWFAGIKWAGGKAPTLTSAGVDTVGFITHDAGTTWYAYKMGLDMKAA